MTLLERYGKDRQNFPMLDVGIHQLSWPFHSSAAVRSRIRNMVKDTMLTLYPGYNAMMDLALALLPITTVWNLNLALQKKIALGTLLSLGILYETSLVLL